MIITRTPFRVSFAGGGSDIPSFYRKHEGCVLSTSINKYMYISIHPTFDRHLTNVKYSVSESVDEVHKLKHPIARQLLSDYGISGVEIDSIADIPSGTGLSTSSAYTVGLINALNAFAGKYESQEKIASKACFVEINELHEPIGKQDQYGTAVGGIKFIRFLPDDTVEVEPIIISSKVKKELNENLLLFYTGFTHSAGQVLKEQSQNMINSEIKFQSVIHMTELAKESKIALMEGDLRRFGEILNENWQLKRQVAAGVTNSFIDELYDTAIKNGALGGKLLGAGGGGFLLVYCEKEKQDKVRSALKNLSELPFQFENGGTKVVYVGDKDW